ncbi:hypothetical protein ABB55_08500 [Prosthecomicrobium hirschii]|uniref:HicB-like antitoxin of toxin-antitoxin system domain-containing protein n=1 Tax=Prosthecodimorpha hirschii TaxID=665126 RepID=A0A0P6W4Q1_9HYPH|nr:type II toxin-antitoxin system HicB family antitoxin [Prosthecomicrobium hirschii]KPL52266.1 hypothetical protein ABB55_08500 [Prosthecomicrobium hirschii]
MSYAVRLEPEDGVVLVSCRDLREVVTNGATVAEALEQAADAIETAIGYRRAHGEAIPAPSPVEPGEYVVTIPGQA